MFFKVRISVLLFVLFAQGGIMFAQDFQSTFQDLLSAKDTAGQRRHLARWDKESPTDPERFIAHFNYHLNLARMEMMEIRNEPGNGEVLEFRDSTGALAGYIGSIVVFDSSHTAMAISWIDSGIALHPKRLDMRFGRAYLCIESDQFEAFNTGLIKCIQYGQTIGNSWLWKDNQLLEDGDGVIREGVHSYVLQLYNLNRDEVSPYIRSISEALLVYYPEHIESLSDVAISWMLEERWDKALDYLLKAEKLSPKDVVVLNNIATAYERLNDNIKAKIYLKKVIRYGNKEDKRNARARFRAL